MIMVRSKGSGVIAKKSWRNGVTRLKAIEANSGSKKTNLVVFNLIVSRMKCSSAA